MLILFSFSLFVKFKETCKEIRTEVLIQQWIEGKGKGADFKSWSQAGSHDFTIRIEIIQFPLLGGVKYLSPPTTVYLSNDAMNVPVNDPKYGK